MKHCIKAGIFVAISVASAGPAVACMGDKVLYDEDFSFADAGWGPLSSSFDISDGAATLKPDADGTALHISPNFAFSDADICVTLAQSGITDATDAYGGLMFWAKDSKNFLAYVYATDGTFEVVRYQNGGWTPKSPVPWTKTDAIRQGAGVANTLRVTIKGQLITLGINGTQVARFQAPPPDGNTNVGLFAASEAAKPDSFAFQNLEVTDVVDAAAPPPAPAVESPAAPSENAPTQSAQPPEFVPPFKDTSVGKWSIIESLEKGARDCDMGVDAISANWGFDANLLDDAQGPILEMQVFSHAANGPDINDIESIDPKPITATTRIDGQVFSGDSTVETVVGIVSYTLRYRGADGQRLAARLQSRTRNIEIVAAGKRFNIPVANFNKALALAEQCYPLWLGHPLKWQ